MACAYEATQMGVADQGDAQGLGQGLVNFDSIMHHGGHIRAIKPCGDGRQPSNRHEYAYAAIEQSARHQPAQERVHKRPHQREHQRISGKQQHRHGAAPTPFGQNRVKCQQQAIAHQCGEQDGQPRVWALGQQRPQPPISA